MALHRAPRLRPPPERGLLLRRRPHGQPSERDDFAPRILLPQHQRRLLQGLGGGHHTRIPHRQRHPALQHPHRNSGHAGAHPHRQLRLHRHLQRRRLVRHPRRPRPPAAQRRHHHGRQDSARRHHRLRPPLGPGPRVGQHAARRHHRPHDRLRRPRILQRTHRRGTGHAQRTPAPRLPHRHALHARRHLRGGAAGRHVATDKGLPQR